MIVGLLGGVNIAKYSIADVLWKKMSELSNIKFSFKFIAIENFTDLCRFYWSFYESKDLIGFNVALPWKVDIVNLVDQVDEDSRIFNSVNVVYKKNKEIRSANTDVIGMEKALLGVISNISSKKILILGAGGAGLPTAIYLHEKYRCVVHIYDVCESLNIPESIIKLKDRCDIGDYVYDVIINATPIGKYYFDKVPNEFSLPLSIDLVKKITHKDSVIQEMNYFPLYTQLLKFAKLNSLVVVSGVDMLVYQALETFKLYTGYVFLDSEIIKLLEFMRTYSLEKENGLLR